MAKKISQYLKYLYIFTGGRKQRIQEIEKRIAPSEFMFGAFEMKKKGFNIDLIEMDELSHAGLNESKSPNIIDYVSNKLTGLVVNSRIFSYSIDQLNRYDHIICSNDYVALCLYPYCRKGKLKVPVSFFVMGQLANTMNDNLFSLSRWAGKHKYGNLIELSQNIFFLGKGEYRYALESYPRFKHKMHFLPFAVDTLFWTPDKNIKEDDYILSIGNDKARDWQTALKIVKKMPDEKFKFVTKNTEILKTTLPKNAEVIKGDWKEHLLTDNEIKDLYYRSKMVMLPIKNTLQPSGQSVCLQAMSCGKPVIISDYKGLWDRETILNNVHYLTVPNSPEGFINAINNLNNDKNRRLKMGSMARKLIEDKYSIELFSKQVQNYIGKE